MKQLYIIFTNADVLTFDKRAELKARIDFMMIKPQIIAIQEVKPKHFRYESQIEEYKLDGYYLYSINLENTNRGRGMIVYIQND